MTAMIIAHVVIQTYIYIYIQDFRIYIYMYIDIYMHKYVYVYMGDLFVFNGGVPIGLVHGMFVRTSEGLCIF